MEVIYCEIPLPLLREAGVFYGGATEPIADGLLLGA